MRRLAPFERRQLAPSTEITTKCEAGNVLTGLTMKFGGKYTASGAGNSATDGPFHWMGRPQIKCGTRSIVDMPGPDLRHLAAAIAGTYPEAAPPAIVNSPDAVHVAHIALPFNKFLDGVRIDGRQEEITLRTRLGAPTDLGTTVTGVSGYLDAFGDTDDTFDDSGIYFEPDFRTVEIPLFASSRNAHVVKFDHDEIVVGFQFRALDESLRLTDPNLSRPDWLIRSVQIDRQKARQARTTIVPPLSFSMLKQQQSLFFGIPAVTGQLHKGVGLIMLDDPTTPNQEVAFFEAGDQLTVLVDASSPIDPDLDLSTNGTIEVGNDKAFVTIMGFRVRGRAYEANRRGALAAAGIRAS